MQLKTYLAERLPLVERRLADLLPKEGASEAAGPPRSLAQAMRYATLGGGKRFRPLVCIASAEAVAAGRLPPSEDSAVLDAACAIEFVHCFSLIHDDLPALDNDDFRRGRPTCHKAFGEAIAILAGDALFCLAFETLANLRADAEVRTAAIRTLAEASGTNGMVGGQTLDIESSQSNTDIHRLLRIHHGKTAALISASCRMGALVARGTKDQVETCASIGRKIGLSFQITDDILNETASEAAIGKPVGSDKRLSKATFPSVLGIDASKRLAADTAREAMSEADRCFEGGGTGLRLLARYAIERGA